MFFIRRSLSSTRKLFQRTIQHVKSLFTQRTTYQRLPKSSSFRHFSCQSYGELDRFYSEFTNRWDNEINVEDNVVESSTSPIVEVLYHMEKDVIERKCLVAEKLKDMEMIDSNNLDNVQDIEEVLHLYSLLTCPVYIDMFEKFVMDMYSDIFNLKSSSNERRNRAISSRSGLPHSSLL